MSGFFGAVNLAGPPLPAEVCSRIAATMAFRGNRSPSVQQTSNASTCFVPFLTGPAPQSTAQPVFHGSNWVIGDIRLDGRADLLAEIRKRHPVVDPQATSEQLLLLTWDLWGQDALPRLLGDFSFAIWDDSLRQLFLVRDFVGSRPLFYVFSNRTLFFTNTLATLLQIPEISRELDPVYLREFLRLGYCEDRQRTPFTHIRRVPSGYVLSTTLQDVPALRPFIELPVEDLLYFSDPREYSEAYRDVLCQAVADRLPRAPTALYLSGGLDSASVCATASRIVAESSHPVPLKAFTIGWRPLLDDPEPALASLTANFLNLPHETFEEDQYVPFAAFDDLPALPEPYANPFRYRSYRHDLAISRYAGVVLSGDGGDDVLNEQAWDYLRHLYRAGEWSKMPGILWRFALHKKTIPSLHLGILTAIRRLSGAYIAPEDHPEWLIDTPTNSPETLGNETLPPPTRLYHPVHPESYTALHRGYWASVLECEDAGVTGVPLQSRAPILDRRVLRFLLRLPPVPWCTDKYLVRCAMSGLLPDEVLLRPKTPLVGDPLQVVLHRSALTSSRLQTWTPSPYIHRFVIWEKWLETLNCDWGLTPLPNLYPLFLDRWLKDIEKAGWIQ